MDDYHLDSGRFLHRHLGSRILKGLQDTPVVFIRGPRQAGKSTLVRWIASERHPSRYLTLDDAAVLAAASNDPEGFLAGLSGAVVLDEVQRVPELFMAIKASVDRDRRPGRYLLTGSADVLFLPEAAGQLVGRMEVLTLWPFSQGEITGYRERFVDTVFDRNWSPPVGWPSDPADLLDRLLLGGFPEVLQREPSRRRDWFEAYMTTVLHREVRELARIEGLAQLPRLLSLLAARATTLTNYAEWSSALGIPQTTLKRYVSLLEATFLVWHLPAWTGSLARRLIKTARTMVADTGLMGHLLGIDKPRLKRQPDLLGPLLEDFVGTELRKQINWSQGRPALYHFRTHAGHEVDFVLEAFDGSLVGLEVKAGTSLGVGDLKGLKRLREAAPDRFVRGLVLYRGTRTIPFAHNLHALPVQALWQPPEPA